MKVPPGIVLLEGADASGKSTLAKYLVEHHGARYLHGRVWKNMSKWHAGMMRRAERLVDAGNLICIDRHFISELIYGPIFRGGAHYSNFTAADFDERICAAPGAYVLCVPTDAKKHLKRFEDLKAKRPEAFGCIEQVVQRYQDLLHGNVAHPGDNYVDTFIRFGDFREGRRVHHHDIDDPKHTVKRAAKQVLEMLAQ